MLQCLCKVKALAELEFSFRVDLAVDLLSGLKSSVNKSPIMSIN